MEQFHSFDWTKFEESIQNKTNFTRLRVSVVNAIRNDPTSSRDEADRALRMLWKGYPEVFEKKRDLEYEEQRPDPAAWDKDYFLKYATYVEDNFCPERIKQLREIGKKVYGSPVAPAVNRTPLQSAAAVSQKTPQRAAQPKAAKSTTPNPTRAPEPQKPPLAAGLLIVAVLVLMVLVVCLMGKETNAHAAAAILNMPEMLPLFPQQLT